MAVRTIAAANTLNAVVGEAAVVAVADVVTDAVVVAAGSGGLLTHEKRADSVRDQGKRSLINAATAVIADRCSAGIGNLR